MIPFLSLQYLGELSLIDADPYLKYLPSVIAAAAFHLADYTITGQTWVCTTKPWDLTHLYASLVLFVRSFESWGQGCRNCS